MCNSAHRAILQALVVKGLGPAECSQAPRLPCLRNPAASQSGDSRFLGFYRVLEYFFYRATVKEVDRARIDPAVATDTLIELARAQRELDQLKHLLRSTMTAGEKRAIVSLTARKGLVKKATLEHVAEALYSHRNSLVHAKESELARTRLPNPLSADSHQPLWDKFAEEVASVRP